MSGRSNGTLVVVTSNAGGAAINRFVLERMRSGSSRDEITRAELMSALEDTRMPLLDAARRQPGVKARVLPFLPLSRAHVRRCARREIVSQGLDATETDVDAVVSGLGFFDDDFPVLAKTGCKQVAGKVDVFLGGQDPYLLG